MRIAKVVFGEETVVYLDNGEKLEDVIAIEVANSIDGGRIPSVKVEVLMTHRLLVDVCKVCAYHIDDCRCAPDGVTYPPSSR